MTAERTPQDQQPPDTPRHAKDLDAAEAEALAIDPKRSMIRAVAWVLGVLFLQFAFIYSYVGAFHDPEPHELKVQVVAPQGGQAPG